MSKRYRRSVEPSDKVSTQRWGDELTDYNARFTPEKKNSCMFCGANTYKDICKECTRLGYADLDGKRRELLDDKGLETYQRTKPNGEVVERILDKDPKAREIAEKLDARERRRRAFLLKKLASGELDNYVEDIPTHSPTGRKLCPCGATYKVKTHSCNQWSEFNRD